MQSKAHLSRLSSPFAVLAGLFLALALAGPAQAQATDSDSEPQPISRADSNESGANGQCPEEGAYCSTRDGSASKNGNGGGEANGKPCAGCVGRADNKNPQGQEPDASDHNNGYECDGNNGVGKGNPAHTACTDDEKTNSDEPGNSEEPGNQDEPGNSDEPGNKDEPGNSDEPDVLAGADTPSSGPGDEVAGVQLAAQPNAELTTTNAAAQPARTAPMVLPQTGASDSLLMLLLTGLGLAAIGGTTMLFRRRSATSR